MPSNPTGFRVTDTAAGWNATDLDDIFVRKDCFLEGGLWIWGQSSSGRLGTNANILQSSPVQTVSGGTNWKQVSLGTNHSGAVKTDGTLWMWGLGSSGQLGDNIALARSSPVQVVSGGTNWKQVSLGTSHSSGIKEDGTLWMWGSGTAGAIGNHSTINRSSPVQTVSGGTDWNQVSLGLTFSAAIKTDGTLWLWGLGTAGRLGDNTVANKSSPVQTISGGTNWKQVSLGAAHSTAVKTDGTLWLWGDGLDGEIGNNSSLLISSPVQTISGGTNWKQVSAGCAHTAAIKTDGSLWLWGKSSSGELGDNNIISRSSPVQTISGGTNWRQVSAGRYHSAAIKTDGTLWLWGYGNLGILGNNSSTNSSSPIQTISGGTNWRRVNLGGFHSTAIREDCW